MEYVQWFGIEVIYAHELMWLPVVVLLLHFTHKANSVAGRTLHWLLYAAVAFYLISFHMHRYSHWAWPVILALFVYHRIRGNWPWVVSWRLGDLRPWLASRPRWQVMTGAALLVLLAAYMWLARLPWWFLGLLVLVAGGIALVLAILAWLRGGERGLLAYLDLDPRMGDYLDWVRRVQGVSSSVSSLLAENRLNARPDLLGDGGRSLRSRWSFWHPTFWIGGLWLFGLHRIPGLCFLARLYWRARRHWLDSAFVVDFLAHVRERAWCEYEAARWGKTIDNYLDAALEGPHLPVECKEQAAPGRRLRWLLLTEAMAEQYALANPHNSLNDRCQPNLLRAADQLGGAGQLQLEIAWDFEKAEAVDQTIQRELRLAGHFYDLSARCLEAYLDEKFQPSPPTEPLASRADRFCRPLQEDNWWGSQNGAVSEEAGAEQQVIPEGSGREQMANKLPDWADFCRREARVGHIRLALAWHYLLIAALSARSADADQQASRAWLKEGQPGSDLFQLLVRRLQKYPLPEGGNRPQAMILHGAAQVSYLLECKKAVEARQVFRTLLPGTGEEDYLAHLADGLHNLGQWHQIEPRRIWMLLGMIQEASMPGTRGDNWNLRLTNAVDAYSQAASPRAWRLHALQLRTQGAQAHPGTTQALFRPNPELH